MFVRSRVLRLLVLLLSFLPAARIAAVSNTIVISQVYGGGGNSGATYKNDFVELFNRGTTTVSLNGWSVQYGSATGTTWQVTNLTNVSLAPGQYYLVQEAQGAGGSVNLPTPDATGTIAMGATAGKIALVSATTALSGACPTGGAIVDFVGFGTTANCSETAPAPAPSNTTADLRGSGGCTETDANSTDFASGAPNPRNTATTLAPCSGGSLALSINDVALAEGNSGTTTFTFTVSLSAPAPAGGVTFNIATQDSTATVVDSDYVTRSLIGQSISAGNSTYTFDVTVNGDATVEPNETFFVNVTSVVGTGVTVADGQGVGTITNDDVVLTPIYTIQGSGATSPLVSTAVSTSGIVIGVKSNGFFLQDPLGDGNPNTSDGIFVFTSSAPPAAAAVGNSVLVTGTVQEFIPSADANSPPMTELALSPTVSLLSTGNPLPAPFVLTAADTSPLGAIDQLERFEGMRVSVASMTVVAPTSGTVSEASATATSNGVFYGVITGIARPFREAGVEVPDPLPSGAPCCVPRFDANPERLRVDGDGLVGGTALEVTSGAVVTNLVGPLDYGFRTYTILPDPGSSPGVSGNVTFTPVPLPASDEFTVTSFNMQRFFDTADEPGVSDVVLTGTAFNNRLNKASLAIRSVLRTPDIIGVEEMENLTTLQAVATKVNADAVAASEPDPSYQAFLVEGNDVGGIDVGFLVKSSRVSVVDVTQVNKDETYTDPNTGNPALLNDRPSLVLRATVAPPSGPAFPITVIVNHLRSLSGVDDPADGNRVRTKRRAQAESLANLIQARQIANSAERIISLGDYNAFQVNDGYVDVIGTVKGTPTPATDVVLASADLVNPDLTDLLDLLPAADRYSYSFDGNAQVLDHELVNAALLPFVSRVAYARSNADFPESFRNDPNRPERISDHDMAVAYVRFPAPATATVSGDATICFGSATTIQAALTGTPPWSVTWSDSVVQSNVLSSPATRVVNPTVTTTYTVTAVADANGPGTASGSAQIVVSPPPPQVPPVMTAPSFVGAGSPNRAASVASITGAAYLWTITNGTITAGQGTNEITFTAGSAGTPLTLNVSLTLGPCPYGGASANVTVLPAGSAVPFYTVTPCRIVDTRGATGPAGGPALPAGGADRTFVLAGSCGIPSGAAAVSANLTVVSPPAGGTLEVYRGDGAPSGMGSISFNAGKTRANNALVQLALDGSGTVKVNNASTGPVHFVLDVNGYFQ
ncbi:MAG: lamin tail domain-containing protein [Acidobacteria bacterium]|nr:lamin tail domain-containing protein [Acidobacteriota bacterium]